METRTGISLRHLIESADNYINSESDCVFAEQHFSILPDSRMEHAQLQVKSRRCGGLGAAVHLASVSLISENL